MNNEIVSIYRNEILESVHKGHGVVMHANGDILFQIGDPDRVIFPRSSCKMIQALPLIESGAAGQAGLGDAQLALACASHNGEDVHVDAVGSWLKNMNLSVDDLRCGPQRPERTHDRLRLHDQGLVPTRLHNNCSGKHAGFLTLNQHLGGNPEYHQLDHPVQLAVKQAFEDMTGEVSAGFGIDGCSAPNFTTTVRGLARAAAQFSRGSQMGGLRGDAAQKFTEAMIAYPILVSGTGRACAKIMRAGGGQVAAKTGAEGVFIAILPQRQMGIAIKAEDGATRAAETAIASLLVRLGVLDLENPEVNSLVYTPITNFNQSVVGSTRPSEALWQGGAAL